MQGTLFETVEARPSQSTVTEPMPVAMWSASDRPVDKFWNKGAGVLTDTELLAILIGGSYPVEIARKLMRGAQNSLDDLARMSTSAISTLAGISKAKAVAICAALELSRRRREVNIERPRISGSADCFNLLRADMMDLQHEEFWVLLLNRANRVIRKKRISEGGISGTVADPRIIFKLACEELACGIVVAHNHPSGNLVASQTDIELTKRLKMAGVVMEVQLLDHLIHCRQ